jgi:GDP-L-fucose synthase
VKQGIARTRIYGGKRVLVTGATGLIGSSLVQELLKYGASIRATVHVREPDTRDPRVEYVTCDLTQVRDCVRVCESIDYAFLCAANTSGAHAIATRPLVHVTENLIMNARMFEATEHVERCLFISSSTVYPPADYPVKEAEAFSGDPHPSYFGSAWMKRYCEKLAEFYCDKYDRQIVVVRPTNVFGRFDTFDFATSHVLPALIRRAVEKQSPFEVWGDGSAVRDFIYVTDMVDGLLRAMENWKAYDPVNIGSGSPVTIRQAVETVLRLAGHDSAEVVYDPSKPTTIPFRLVDLTKAETELGFKPKFSFEDGLRETIEWYREFGCVVGS